MNHRILVITDPTAAVAPLQLPDGIPLLVLGPQEFTPEEWETAPLVLLDDRYSRAVSARELRRRPGLLLAWSDPDDATVYDRAVSLGAEEVVAPRGSEGWLTLRMHAETNCAHVDWDRLLRDGPDGVSA